MSGNRQARRGCGKSRGTRSHKGGGRWDRLADERAGVTARGTAWCVECSEMKPDGHHHGVMSRQPKRYECWLCHEVMATTGKQALDAHKTECPRRKIQRACGICDQPLPLDYPMSRKFHVGACDVTAERRMYERAWYGPPSVAVWPAERIQLVSGALLAAPGRSRYALVAPAFGVAPGTLSNYVVRWRRSGIIIPRIGYRHPFVTRRPGQIATHYPYEAPGCDLTDALVVRVNAAVPPHLSDAMRADVCQEMLADLVAGDLAPGNIEGAAHDYIKRVRGLLAPWNERSMESMNYEDGKPWLDRHATRSVYQERPDEPLGHPRLADKLTEAFGWPCPVCGKAVLVAAHHEVCAVIAQERARGRGRQNLGWQYMRHSRAS